MGCAEIERVKRERMKRDVKKKGRVDIGKGGNFVFFFWIGKIRDI